MTISATTRDRRHIRARRGFAVFVLVWLNFAFLPCSLAVADSDDHDCPHCPPAHTGEHGEHAMSVRPAAAVDMPCATSTIDCSPVDNLKFDGRNTELKLKDAPSDVPLAICPSVAEITPARSVAEAGWYPARSPPPGSRTPLNILYCVYLD